MLLNVLRRQGGISLSDLRQDKNIIVYFTNILGKPVGI